MGFRIVEFEETPNPNAVKCVLDKPVSRGTVSFRSARDAAGDPIAARLFAIPGVVGVMLREDFATVNKAADADWGPIKAKVRKALADAPDDATAETGF